MPTIAELNDSFRGTFTGGRVLLTRAIAALPGDLQMRIVQQVRAFDKFTEDNDPHGEHDMGFFEEFGHRCMWKIDYYDKADQDYGSDNPADPDKTLRVLTIMLSSDY
jgi:hypothetical protein